MLENSELTTMVNVVLRTTIIFLYALLLLRLLGKRRLAHLTYLDILLIIAFGSAVGDVMIYDDSTVHLLTSMVAITVVALIVKILQELTSHWGRAQHLLEGQARLLVDNGKIQRDMLEREDMSEEHLRSLLRQRGHHSTTHLKKVFIEPDGELSIIPRSHRS